MINSLDGYVHHTQVTPQNVETNVRQLQLNYLIGVLSVSQSMLLCVFSFLLLLQGFFLMYQSLLLKYVGDFFPLPNIIVNECY